MKTEITSKEWDEYNKLRKAFEEKMAAKKPKEPHPLDYPTLGEFIRAMDDYRQDYSEWRMAYSCDAPNKPGYFRANND